VKVIARPSALFPLNYTHPLTAVRPLSVRRRHTDRRYGVEADFFFLVVSFLTC